MECSKIYSYTKNTQISDSLGLNLLLAFSGGLQDAYTYLMRGHVFANAQTGNVVLLSSHFIQKEFSAGFMYAVPLLSFALGILFSESIHLRFKNAKKMHWRQAVLLLEICVLFAVAFVPTHLHFVANALVSFSCALQVQAFRSVHGNAYASTMCIGNLRGAMEALADFAKSKKYDDMHR
ncbi:MAG: DUF1275 domain-containing protein, partial [Treponema sp.]|nr:DUF1275 domain-containing protein [Treponema sp.]